MVTTTLNEAKPDAAAHEWTTPILSQGRWFKDEYGRTLLMRGVNLAGSSKLPTHPYPGSTHLYDEKLFWDHQGVSFVGRPLLLKEARLHFARLRAWGLTLIRLLIPWESIEHAGPGIYDEEYIDYLRQLIGMMPEYGLKCFIDPHQDTWSRYSGGSGAPGWTFEIAGLDIRAFKETGAAYVHNTNAVPGDPLPMVWPTNYTKLASCTMFTLFFAGDTFAPKHKYQGQSIQQFLSQHFIDAYAHLASRLADLEAVIGFEVMNEPHPGYIGLETLHQFDPIVNLIFGDSPTPLQSFALGDGIPQEVDVYVKSWPFPTRKSHTHVINSSRTSAWLPGQSCIWRQHGVWKLDDLGNPVLVDSAYFSKNPATGEKIEFYRDFYVPFVNRYAEAIHKIKKDWFCFVEPLANEESPVFTEKDYHHNIVYAPHWYDLNCVFYKKFNGRITHDVQALQNGHNVVSATYFGRKGAKTNYRGQIRNIKASGLANMGEKPCIFGEVGIPMDLNERIAFTKGDYANHIHFMDAVIHALEVNLVNFTLWNYDPCNDDIYGDQWNGENFSIYSPPVHVVQDAIEDSQKDGGYDITSVTTETLGNMSDSEITMLRLYEGGRVLHAAIRPYASRVAGVPVKSEFDIDTLEYIFAFNPYTDADREKQQRTTQLDDPIALTTTLYIPHYHYNGRELEVQVSHGRWQYESKAQTLYHTYTPNEATEMITINIRVKGGQAAKPKLECAVM